ncbi:MAG: SUMF1/EgtB/PvdO family nonheme iron enzyme [Acidobacteriota bacterium]
MFKYILSAALFIVPIVSVGMFAQTRPPKDDPMALIPGGTFKMGTDRSKVSEIAAAFKILKHPELIEAETPQHLVTLRPFYMDKFEVTNELFAKFLEKRPEWLAERVPAAFNNGNYLKDWLGNKFPGGKERAPVVNISWYAAVAYCQSIGQRLPTEAEWEYAARGGLVNKTFPWGDSIADPTKANYSASKLNAATLVGSYSANGFGLFDMAGNVWEFTVDEWQPYSSADQTDPVAGDTSFKNDGYLSVTTRRVIRGGSWGGSPLNLRVAYRDSHPVNGSQDFVGFRCAK